MKTLLLITLVILGGLGSAYTTYQYRLESDDSIRTAIINTMNHIKETDHGVNTLILKSRYGLTANYDEITRLTRQLSRGAQLLDSGKLQHYPKENTSIERTIDVLRDQISLKLDLIESFKSHNSILRNSINYAPILGEKLIVLAESKKATNRKAIQQLKTINDALYRWALYGNSKDTLIIEENTHSLNDLHNVIGDRISLLRYTNHVVTVVDEQEKTQRFIEKALDINTQSTINQLETDYLNHYVKNIKHAQQSLYYVFAYIVFVLVIAAYLSWILKSTYSRLRARDSYRSQQIHVAHKHLAYADGNVDKIKLTFHHIRETMAYLDGIYTEAKSKSNDPQRIRSLLSHAISKYHFLDKNDSLNEADALLDKSNKDLEKASSLVKSLVTSE